MRQRRSPTVIAERSQAGKTSLVAFARHADAELVLRSLDEFHRARGRFPWADYAEGASELDQLRAPRARRRDGGPLDTEKFACVGDLRHFCRAAHLHVCLCTEVRVRAGGALHLAGEFVDVEPEPAVSREVLGWLLQRDPRERAQ